MASIWATIHKRHELRYDAEAFTHETVDPIFKGVYTAAPKLVNITDHVARIYNGPAKPVVLSALDVTPCFACMWFEWQQPQRMAVMTRRFPVSEALAEHIAATKRKMLLPPPGAAHFIQMLMFVELDGWIEFHGVSSVYVDKLGRPTEEGIGICAATDEGDTVRDITFVVAEAITLMNTVGTRIEPPFDSKPTQKVKPDRAPCSVWHTIHLPRFAHPSSAAAATVSPEVLERREHWVRAHRRDYRDGGGMFGRIKALVWVPEYQRGNSELGTVKQSYVIHKQE